MARWNFSELRLVGKFWASQYSSILNNSEIPETSSSSCQNDPKWPDVGARKLSFSLIRWQVTLTLCDFCIIADLRTGYYKLWWRHRRIYYHKYTDILLSAYYAHTPSAYYAYTEIKTVKYRYFIVTTSLECWNIGKYWIQKKKNRNCIRCTRCTK